MSSRPFSTRLKAYLGEERGAQRRLAISLGRVADSMPAAPPPNATALDRRNDAVRAQDYSPHVSRWVHGATPGSELVALLSRTTGKSVDYWLNGAKSEAPEASRWGSEDSWVYEGLVQTMPLQSHVVWEYRSLLPLALRLAERLQGSRKTEAGRRAVYRRAGELLGEALAAPLTVLGVAGLPPHEQRIAQGYLVAAAGAVSLMVDFAAATPPRKRPVARRPQKRVGRPHR